MSRPSMDDTAKVERHSDRTSERGVEHPRTSSGPETDHLKTAAALERNHLASTNSTQSFPSADATKTAGSLTFSSPQSTELQTLLYGDNAKAHQGMTALLGHASLYAKPVGEQANGETAKGQPGSVETTKPESTQPDPTKGESTSPPHGAPHSRVFEDAKVRKGEGAYQSVDRMLGDDFSHKDKLALAHAMKHQYGQEVGSKPELAGRKADMSDLHVGHSLLTKENFDSVMQRLKETNPELQSRVASALSQDHPSHKAKERDGASDGADHGTHDGQGSASKGGGRRRGAAPDNYDYSGGTSRSDKGDGNVAPVKPDKGDGTIAPATPESSKKLHPAFLPAPDGSTAQEMIKNFGHELADSAIKIARRLHTVGDCAHGPRLVLEKHLGVQLPHVVATEQGKIIAHSGLFEKVDNPQVGDYGVRDWNRSVTRAHGGVNKGDSFIVTGVQKDGTMHGANDHQFVVPPDGGRYRNLTFYRLAPHALAQGGDQSGASAGATDNAHPANPERDSHSPRVYRTSAQSESGHTGDGSDTSTHGSGNEAMRFPKNKPIPEQHRAGLISSALDALDMPSSAHNLRLVNTMIEKESSWRHGIVNHDDANARRGTPSKGLMQTIDSTFHEFHVPGMDNIMHPVHNIAAGINYALHRYGSLDNVPGIRALAHGHHYRGY